MKYLACLVFCLLFEALFSQTNSFPIGQIVDSVEINESSNKETFALYLPNSYNTKELSAIIFIFDPVARGEIGIKVFKEAAEKFNYILVCSNNSKNGPYDINFGIANRLFEYVFATFNIDKNRIYTAGFSGGARLASSIAVLTNQIQGVIACGAGFANNARPNLENKFSYVSLVGNEDMNYQEVYSNKTLLKNLGIEHEVFSYDDTHRWPPKEQIQRALGWLELQAYKRNLKVKDNKVVAELYDNSFRIQDSLAVDQIYDSVEELLRMQRSFQPYIDTKMLDTKLDSLKKLELYKKQVSNLKKTESLEYQLSEKFLNRYRKESILGRTDDNYNWWKIELKKLHNYRVEPEDIYTLKMLKRIKYRLFAMAIENSNTFTRIKSWNQAVYCDKLLTLMLPKNPIWYYRLAKSYAQLNDFSATLYNLKKSVKLGLKNTEQIKTQREFNKFKDKKKFQKFLESLD